MYVATVLKDLTPAIATIVAAIVSYLVGRANSKDSRARLATDVDILTKLNGEPELKKLMRESIVYSLLHLKILEERRVTGYAVTRLVQTTAALLLFAFLLSQSTQLFELGRFENIAKWLAIFALTATVISWVTFLAVVLPFHWRRRARRKAKQGTPPAKADD